MEKLEIKKDDAIVAHQNAKKSGKELLENLFGKKVFQLDIKERLKTFDDVLAENNITIEDFENSCKGLTSDEIGYRKEKLIVAAYNGNKLPDFTDGSTKYYPIFKMGSPSGVGFSFSVCDYWNTASDVGSRLVFHGENAKANMYDAVEKFLPEYQQSRTT